MGNRMNFGFKNASDGPTIYLYSHWGPEGMMDALATALDAARPRWTDAEYATRITISHIIGDDWRSETGWGLSVDYLCDNEHSVPVVDWEAGTVSLYPAKWNEVFIMVGNTPKFTMDLDSFVKKFKRLDSHPYMH